MENSRRRAAPAGARRRRGSVFIMFAFLLVVLLGFMALALDLAQLYSRQAKLQNGADSVALAAARELNGTAPGISAALAKALAANPAPPSAYTDGFEPALDWTAADIDEAIRFSDSATAAEADWVSAASAAGAPDGKLFVKFDTSLMTTTPPGRLQTFFGGFLSSTLLFANTAARAVAGRSGIRLTPLAVCALSSTPYAAHDPGAPPASTDLVEYGFRRGVGYNLLKLSPHAAWPAQNFVVNPLDPLGTLGSPARMTTAVVAPFVCTGTMPRTRVMGAGVQIAVANPFPAALVPQLNARFNNFADAALCNVNSAPPDRNIREYRGAALSWMTTSLTAAKSLPHATIATIDTFATIADPLVPPTTPSPGTAAADYGPLWAYAKAVKFSAYVAGQAEPSGGYARFVKGNWAALYPVTPDIVPANSPTAANNVYLNVPETWQPYTSIVTAPPAGVPRVRDRRVLNIPLLACPAAVPAGSSALASVLAIGKFYMTVQAAPDAISAEFGGLAPEQSLRGAVELYQ